MAVIFGGEVCVWGGGGGVPEFVLIAKVLAL